MQTVGYISPCIILIKNTYRAYSSANSFGEPVGVAAEALRNHAFALNKLTTLNSRELGDLKFSFKSRMTA